MWQSIIDLIETLQILKKSIEKIGGFLFDKRWLKCLKWYLNKESLSFLISKLDKDNTIKSLLIDKFEKQNLKEINKLEFKEIKLYISRSKEYRYWESKEIE